MLKKTFLFLLGLSVLALTACGGSPSSLSGTWIADYSRFGVDARYIASVSDSGGDLSGTLKTEAAGFSSTVGSFTGERSGSTVTLRFGLTSVEGTLSGNKLRFNNLGNVYSDSLVFVKQ